MSCAGSSGYPGFVEERRVCSLRICSADLSSSEAATAPSADARLLSFRSSPVLLKILSIRFCADVFSAFAGVFSTTVVFAPGFFNTAVAFASAGGRPRLSFGTGSPPVATAGAVAGHWSRALASSPLAAIPAATWAFLISLKASMPASRCAVPLETPACLGSIMLGCMLGRVLGRAVY